MKTKINITSDEKKMTIEMSGEITSESPFPKVMREHDEQKLEIQFKGIDYINSGGVRAWISWTKAMRQAFNGSEMSFDLIPAIMVKQAAQIRGFLPLDSKIKSFIVSYYCDHCHANLDLVFEKGINLDMSLSQSELIKTISMAKCDKCGSPAEIDAVPQDYICILT